jgi:2-amino-4-hydroxy-6-hydroxymethyldihydropteridine diphosphokinase
MDPKTNKPVSELLSELLSKEEKIPFRVVQGEEP